MGERKRFAALGLCLCLASLIFSVALQRAGYLTYLNSDMASEVILAKRQFETRSLVQMDWLYSTEVHTVHMNLLYALAFLVTKSYRTARIIGNTAEAMKVEWDLDFRYLNQPLDNRYEEINEFCRNAAEKLFGPDIFANMPTLMSSEDFSWYLQKIPGIFTYIGSANAEKGIIGTNHQSTYDVDESVLKNGSALAAQFAYDYLLTK